MSHLQYNAKLLAIILTISKIDSANRRRGRVRPK